MAGLAGGFIRTIGQAFDELGLFGKTIAVGSGGTLLVSEVAENTMGMYADFVRANALTTLTDIAERSLPIHEMQEKTAKADCPHVPSGTSPR